MSHSPAADARRLLREQAQRLAAGVDAVEPYLAVPALHRAREVEVIVDEARHDGRAGEIEHLGVGSGVARDCGARAARDDAAFVDRERFDDREVRVDGDDLAAREHGVDVGLRAGRAHRERREHGDRASGERGQRAEHPHTTVVDHSLDLAGFSRS